MTAEVSAEMRDEIDAAARRELTTRATVIRRALRDYLEAHKPRDAAEEVGA